MRSKIILLGAVISVAACVTPSQPDVGVTPVIEVQTGAVFPLALGQAARVQGTQLTIRFVGVSEDSRCPQGVQCVWAGNAKVQLSISLAGSPSAESFLNTTLEPKLVDYGGFRIEFMGLLPAPKPGVTVAPGEYVASLRVSAA